MCKPTTNNCDEKECKNGTACAGGQCLCSGCWTGGACGKGTDTTACGKGGAQCKDCAKLDTKCAKGICAFGACGTLPEAPGKGCDDGDPCTGNDVCGTAGTCQGTPVSGVGSSCADANGNPGKCLNGTCCTGCIGCRILAKCVAFGLCTAVDPLQCCAGTATFACGTTGGDCAYCFGTMSSCSSGECQK